MIAIINITLRGQVKGSDDMCNFFNAYINIVFFFNFDFFLKIKFKKLTQKTHIDPTHIFWNNKLFATVPVRFSFQLAKKI